jgi:hypothetical protein
MSGLNAWEFIKDKSLKHTDLNKFSPERWMDLLRFFDKFLQNEKDEFEITQEQLDELNKTKKDDIDYEFIIRVNRDEPKTFLSKLNSIFLLCGQYLKRHPGVPTEEMRAYITMRHPKKMGWTIAQYEVVPTAAGEIILPNAENPGKPISLPSLNARVMNSLVKVADVYEIIAGSFTPSELKRLEVSEKIKALKDLSFIFAAASKRVQNNTFTQVNLNTTDVREAEKMMLDLVTKKQS